MSRKRGWYFHYQFSIGGWLYRGSTGYEATRRNENAARLLK